VTIGTVTILVTGKPEPRKSDQLDDALRRRTGHELDILAGLGHHTREHVIRLLGRHPVLRLTSGLRSAVGNRKVGGRPRSYHLRGRAVDAVGDVRDLDSAAATARTDRVNAACTGPEEVIVEDRGGPNQHLHVAW